MRGVAITGIGCVTPVGLGHQEFKAALKAGRSGVQAVSAFDATPYRCKVAAEVRDFRPQDFVPLREARTLPRVAQFAVAAARMALDDAGLSRLRDPARTGILLGTSIGPSSYNFEQFGIFLERGSRRMHPSFPAYAHNGMVASECAIELGINGPVMSISSACVSGADAIGMARLLIRQGVADVVLAGGSEAPLTPLLFGAFDRLSLMSSTFNETPFEASRPFAADRAGFVLGEGAAILVIEDEAHAAARGKEALAILTGYGGTCDAASHFSQAEGGEEAARAIEIALDQAGLCPADIDYVNAHGSATIQNDAFETALLRRVFGARVCDIGVSSTKSMVGHLMGAAGAVELAATVIGIRNGFIPPTMNLLYADPLCDLDYVPNAARNGQINNALSLSFGFGSRNAALVVGGGHGRC